MNIFSEIKLGDVVTFQRGFDITKAEQTPGSIPIISSSGISSFHNKSKVKPPGVIIGRKGTLGTVHFVNQDYWPHDTTLWVKDFKDNVPRFIYYFLQTLKLENFDTGSSNPTLNRNHVHKITVFFPEDREIQRKIAAILTAYDDLIETNKRRIDLLEKMAEEIYREWFVRLRFPGYQNTQFIKGIPEGWEIARVDSLGKVVTGKTPSTSIARYYNGQYPFIKTPDMHGNMFILETSESLSDDGIQSQASQTIPKGSLCVSCIGTGGIVSITTERSQTNQQINSICLKRLEDLEWGYFVLQGLKETIQLFGSTGTTMTNLSKGKFSGLKFFSPPIELRNNFHSYVEAFFSEIQVLATTNRNLTKTRDLLLPRLISGKLPVEHLDIQTPPSMNP
jgi:type I restriction enzyme S subunit